MTASTVTTSTDRTDKGNFCRLKSARKNLSFPSFFGYISLSIPIPSSNRLAKCLSNRALPPHPTSHNRAPLRINGLTFTNRSQDNNPSKRYIPTPSTVLLKLYLKL